MPRPLKPPRLVHWKGDWHIFYYDHLSRKRKRVSCVSLRADNEKKRKDMLAKFAAREHRDIETRWRLGALDYRRPVVEAIGDYLAYIDGQEKVRADNPTARQGLTKSAAKSARFVPKELKGWLIANGHEKLPCEALDGGHLTSFLNWLASAPVLRGKSIIVHRGPVTMNRQRDRLGACLRWLDAKRPRLFPDSIIFKPALKHLPQPKRMGVAYTPETLRAFLQESRKPIPPVAVKRVKGGRTERFLQPVSAVPATPVDRMFLLCALTGCRRGEAERLKWADVDLQRGRIIFSTETKTGQWRILPLVSAPEGDVAPKFLKTLKAWRKEDPKAFYVLPHVGTDKPVHPRNPWQAVQRKVKSNVSPQRLRSNFTSYAASMGIPPAVCALWQGHSAAVAEAHYRQQVLDRIDADSLEGAMGLG